ncbi:hypothetical protein [Ammoniphilus resinae]|uniref:Uncharacterized protein n=1 Tax=Ammoniphilus resinae TaxID=861532 RepID=A0ABS4GNC7_9BACL|nr:hypothetical protein [Ammoniphilus resinae]MBP1931775.1 hypothetical protein [Ammoniphilus resinae]
MDHFDIQAQKKERWFFNRLKKSVHAGSRYEFPTGKGCLNDIIEVKSDALFFRSKKGKKINPISRKKLREAIRFIYHKRTTTRKELEPYSRFNSALMGLLRIIFFDIAKLVKTASGLLRISLKGTRYFPSSAERSPRDLELAKEQGFNVVLMSYFSMRDDPNENWKYHCRRLGLQVLVDSGAFSAWRAAEEGKDVEPIEVEAYAQFLLKHQDDILFGYFTLDVVGDPDATKENTDYLKSMGLKPIEIWHVQSPWELLDLDDNGTRSSSHRDRRQRQPFRRKKV